MKINGIKVNDKYYCILDEYGFFGPNICIIWPSMSVEDFKEIKSILKSKHSPTIQLWGERAVVVYGEIPIHVDSYLKIQNKKILNNVKMRFGVSREAFNILTK